MFSLSLGGDLGSVSVMMMTDSVSAVHIWIDDDYWQQQQPASSTKERWGQNNNKRKRKKHKRQKDGFTVLLVCTHTNTHTHTRNRVENPCRSLQWPQTDDSVNTNRPDAITSTPSTAASKSLLSSISPFFCFNLRKKTPQKFNDVIGAATSRKKRLTSRTPWLGFKNRTRLGATQVHMKCSLSRPRSTK